MFIEELNPIYETTHKRKEVSVTKEVNPIVKPHTHQKKGFWSDKKLSHM
jgi:hypothetical protein